MLAMIIALLASIVGAISGIGGGVIIKPLLDLSGDYTTAAISILSSATVFSMAAASVWKHVKLKTQYDKKLALWIAFGSVIGGLLGQNMLTYVINQGSFPIKQIQNFILMILLISVLIYMNKFKTTIHWKLENPLPYTIVGIVFGMIATFVGIGGGPINLAALAMFFSLTTKEASVISIVMILFSQASKLIQVGLSGGFSEHDLSILLLMIPAAIIGGFVGSKFNHSFSDKQIHNLFNGVLIFIICTTLFNLICI